MNRSLALLLATLPLATTAQVDSTGTRKDHGTRFMLEASGAYDSNTLRNDLLLGLYQGGELERDLRQRTLDGLHDANRGGYEWRVSASCTWGDSLFGNPRWKPRASLSAQGMMGIRFPKDAYALAFFGNAGYEDRTAHVGPARFEQVAFQSIRFGVEDHPSGSYLELGLVNGQALHTGRLDKADLYTAPDGRYLELALDGEYHVGDTAAGRWSKGIGVAIEGQWNHGIRLVGSPATLRIRVSDLGFVAWNPGSLSVSQDSVIHYEGIEVNGILDLDELVLDRHRIQDSLGLGYKAGGFVRMLPAKAALALDFGREHELPTGTVIRAYTVQVDHRLIPGYIPQASVIRQLVLGKALVAQAGVLYGGFGGLRADVGLGYSARHWGLHVHTPNVIGLASQGAQGRSLAARLDVVW